MKPNPLAVIYVILLITSSTEHYRRGRSQFEKRIEDVFWNSTTSNRQYLHHLNNTVKSWLSSAGHVAKMTCEHTFKYDRWGCRVDKKLFDKVSKESAAVYALLSASLVHQAAMIIAKQKSVEMISTAGSSEEGRTAYAFIKKSVKWTKSYLSIALPLKSIGDLHHQARLHNAKLGLMVIKQSVEKACKCHGFSGSCSMKTCWNILPHYSVVAQRIRIKYISATQIQYSNRPKRALAAKNDMISVLEASDDFCSYLPGRQCHSPAHCKTFCCTAEFVNASEIDYFYCNCFWAANYQLICQHCSQHKIQHYCL